MLWYCLLCYQPLASLENFFSSFPSTPSPLNFESKPHQNQHTLLSQLQIKPFCQTTMASSQLWFLIWEDVGSPTFKQIKITIDDVKQKGLTLNVILNLLSLAGQPDQFSFFMHSVSMRAAVQMLKSEAIQATWQLYCKQDSVITITVRKIDDPSPSSSRAPSYSQALSQRRSASGTLTVPDIPIHTPPRNVSSGHDPSTLDPIADLPEDEKVIISSIEGEAQAVSKEYMLCGFLSL